MPTDSQASTTNLPVLEAANTRGSVTLIAYSQYSIDNFFQSGGKSPDSFDPFLFPPNQQNTSTKAVFEFSFGGSSFRAETLGSFPEPKKPYATVKEYLNDNPNIFINTVRFFKDGQSHFEEFYSPPQSLFDTIDEQYDLAKLERLYAGNDVFIGSSTPSTSNNDVMHGYAGDDVFYGNGDNQYSDIIHGGAGTDTAVYRGKYSEYSITPNSFIWDPVRKKADLTGFLVFDKVANRDGNDQLYQVERLQFSDYFVSLPDLKIIGTVGTASSSSSTVGAGSSPSSSTSSSTNSATTSNAGSSTNTTSGTTSSNTTNTTATTTPAATGPVAPIIPNGTEKNGSDAVDRIQGGSGPDVIRSGGGNDLIIASDGNDYIDGGTGIDQLTYTSQTGSLSFAIDTGGNVQVRLGSKTDTLKDVERVSFTDKAYALDLGGSAGVAAKAIIAAFGKTAVSQYLGIALAMTDKGSSVADLAKIVIENRMLPSDNGQFVQTVFNNVVGRAPNALELLQFKGILDRGEMNTVQLLALAANTSLADTVMSQIAIAGVALEYAPTLA